MATKKQSLAEDFRRQIATERSGSYSAAEITALYEHAHQISRKLEDTEFAEQLPWELFRLLQNIDFGRINIEYRTWVLEDAETALDVWLADR